MSIYPRIKFVHNKSAIGQNPLHFVAGEELKREIEVRAGGFADYDLTGFPWVSNDAEIAKLAIRVSHAGVNVMQMFKGRSDNKLYYTRDGKWDNRVALVEPHWTNDREYYLDVRFEDGTLGQPSLRHYRSQEKPQVRHVRVLFVTAEGVNGVTEDKINGVMQWSNKTLVNSHIPLQLSAVSLAAVEYASTNELGKDLTAMTDNQSLNKRINELRRGFGAEIVAMLVPGSAPNSGLARLNSFGTATPFTVMRQDSMFSSYMNWLAVHEIAHILGVTHEMGFETKEFRTVMSKHFAINHIQHFSNPNSYTPAPYKNNGRATGDATHDAAGFLIKKAEAITNGELSVSEQSTPEVAELDYD